MIFYKSLTRELTLTAIGVFTVLLAVLISTQAINLLGRAAEGSIANDALFTLIGFWAIGLFPILLVLTVFVSTLLVLNRLWRDHEMTVWLSAGQSLTRLLVPVLRFAFPLSILVAIVSLGLAPWADQRSKQYASSLKEREDMSAIAPGIFKESSDAARVYFVESYAGEQGSASHIFFQDASEEKVATIFAQSGYLGTDAAGQRTLVLENGYRYVGMPGDADYQVIAFKRYRVVLGQGHRLMSIPTSRQSMSTLQLLYEYPQANAAAELAWRVSLPLSVLVLAVLAIPLAYFNPRSQHNTTLILALVIYFVYQNMLTFIRNSILNEQINALSMLGVHAVVLLLALLWLYYRRSYPAPWLARKNKST